MNKDYIRELLNCFQEEQRNYLLAPTRKAKDAVERNVREYLHLIDSELYVELNEERGSGLCEPGWFEQDLSRIVRILRDKLR